MYGYSIEKITKVCCGTLIGNAGNASCEPNSIVIDSRKVEPGNLFAAFRGERTDGNDYIDFAFRNGAIACMTDRKPEAYFSGPIILVKDLQNALEKLAFEYMRSIEIPKVRRR